MLFRESHASKKGLTSARRSSRVQTDVLVEVRGEAFAYAGETLTVSMHGALIRTSAHLEIGTSVNVFVHRTGKSTRARIVFATPETGSPCGIEFDQPTNIWGLGVSPLDWHSI